MKKKIFLIIMLVAGMVTGAAAQKSEFPLPEIPGMLTIPADRANYLALHYWDRFDFGNDALVGNADVTEQGFSNFLSIMPHVSKQGEAFAVLFDRAGQNRKMLEHFIDLCEKYLYDMDSPLYDEELYIVALNKLLVSPRVPEDEKERLRYKLGTSLKNRKGAVATNFTYMKKNGANGTLHTLQGDYILLYFNDPECDGCMAMKREIAASAKINSLLDSGRLKLLSVCVEGKNEAWMKQKLPATWIDACDEAMRITDRELYDLPSLPVMYLLDRRHRVVLKNTNPRKIEEFFND